ncbi:MAG: hypothetical protein D6762_07360 [Candidatus Neomarinimicrobiota bacterium]|nr:MAG: hypothetical protein D6762_07360 [Candidatus Neomarinimicrobiota bacterium]
MKTKGWLLLGLVGVVACVGPEQPIDGLIENLPAVTNTSKVFTWDLKANNYSLEESYPLELTGKVGDDLLLNVIVTDVGARLDTTRIQLFNRGDTLLFQDFLTTNQVQTVIDTLQTGLRNLPAVFEVNAKRYTGQVHFTLTVQ